MLNVEIAEGTGRTTSSARAACDKIKDRIIAKQANFYVKIDSQKRG